ncbi:MAG: hypothetical protein JST30_05915 [Armatimonadetes bacterium]|nr:hypothetical protein [Armatimonadota bacterium]
MPRDEWSGERPRKAWSLTPWLVFACMIVFGGGIAGMAFRYVRMPTEMAVADGFRIPPGCKVVAYSHDPALGRHTVVLQVEDQADYDRLERNTPDFFGPLGEGETVQTRFSDKGRRLTVVRSVQP